MQINKGRINKEFTDFSKNAEASNIQVILVGEDINHWKGTILGPVHFFYIFYDLILLYFSKKKKERD